MAKKKKSSNSQTQQPSDVPNVGNFWTPEDKRLFHVAVAQLCKKTELPDGPPQGSRHHKPEHSADYVLSPSEELQLADDIAFLFSWEDQAHYITATTLEEHDDGRRLVIWLGVNDSPPEGVVDEFRDLMRSVERYAAKARSTRRNEARQELLNKVVEMRSRRIVQRLQTLSGRWHPVRGFESQQERLARKITHLKSTPEYSILPQTRRKEFMGICHRLEDLFHVYRALDTCATNSKHSHLVSAILASHDLSTRNSHSSFLSQFEPFCFQPKDIEVNHILQVDKISHYYTFCIHIIHLARQHQTLFSNIEVKTCHRPPNIKPPGSLDTCHVHGEVQLVLHHERAMHQPKPRCLGSSKSLCLLCALFVERHGEYWVSHSHKRLYHKWTIPDTNWMDEEQTLRFQRIVREMTTELIRLRKASGRNGQYPVESRNHLPFSVAPSTASKASLAASVDSEATIRPALLRGESLTPVLEWLEGSTEAKPEQITTPAPDQLSGSTLAADISDEPSFIADSPPHREVAPIIQDRPRLVPLMPSSLPPTLPASDLHSPPPVSSPVPAWAISKWNSSLPTSSPLPALPILVPISPPPSPNSSSPASPTPCSRITRISSTLSPVLTNSSSLPQTHIFHTRSLDLELTVSQTLFIFQFGFKTTVMGNLMLSRVHRTSATRPIIALNGNGVCQFINAADMGRRTVRFQREENRCEFAVGVNGREALRVVVVWDDM